MDNQITLYVCQCSGEGVSVEYDDTIKQVYLTLWDRGFSPRVYGWKRRLLGMWEILRRGRVSTDEVVLDLPTTHALGKLLANIEVQVRQ